MRTPARLHRICEVIYKLGCDSCDWLCSEDQPLWTSKDGMGSLWFPFHLTHPKRFSSSVWALGASSEDVVDTAWNKAPQRDIGRPGARGRSGEAKKSDVARWQPFGLGAKMVGFPLVSHKTRFVHFKVGIRTVGSSLVSRKISFVYFKGGAKIVGFPTESTSLALSASRLALKSWLPYGIHKISFVYFKVGAEIVGFPMKSTRLALSTSKLALKLWASLRNHKISFAYFKVGAKIVGFPTESTRLALSTSRLAPKSWASLRNPQV